MKRKQMKEIDSNSRSVDELRAELENKKKKLLRSIALTVAALIAVFCLTIAWFMHNRIVRGTSSAISAKATAVKVGTLDVPEETNDYWKSEKTKLESLFSMISGNTKVIDGTKYYVTDSGNLSLKLNEDNNFSNHTKDTELFPGSHGKLTFYVIPEKDGYTEFTFTLNLVPFNVRSKTVDGKTQYIKEDIAEDQKADVLAVLGGHILFFKNYDNNDGYSGWINDNQITVKASEYKDNDGNYLSKFQENKAYEVTLYWVWPSMFENITETRHAADGTLENGFLFAETNPDSDLIKQNMFQELKGEEPSTRAYKFFYQVDRNELGEAFDENSLSNLTATQYSCLDKWYNAGDYLIGKNVAYIYLELTNNQQ